MDWWLAGILAVAIVWPVALFVWLDHLRVEGNRHVVDQLARIHLKANGLRKRINTLEEENLLLRSTAEAQDALTASLWAQAIGFEHSPPWSETVGFIESNTAYLRESRYGPRPAWSLNTVLEDRFSRNGPLFPQRFFLADGGFDG